MDAVNVEVGRPEAVKADFAEWARPHLAAMAALAARMASPDERDDVVQEALTAAWRKFELYDDARGTPRAWLLAIVADQARKFYRRRRPSSPWDGTGSRADIPADLDLERAVRGLPARQRLAVALHYFLDLPVAEVAVVMGCAEGTVKATLSHARACLRRELGEDA